MPGFTAQRTQRLRIGGTRTPMADEDVQKCESYEWTFHVAGDLITFKRDAPGVHPFLFRYKRRDGEPGKS